MKSDPTILHLGMDVHQETIAAAIASGDGSLRHYGKIPGYLQAVDTLIKKMQKPGVEPLFSPRRSLLRVCPLPTQETPGKKKTSKKKSKSRPIRY